VQQGSSPTARNTSVRYVMLEWNTRIGLTSSPRMAVAYKPVALEQEPRARQRRDDRVEHAIDAIGTSSNEHATVAQAYSTTCRPTVVDPRTTPSIGTCTEA